MARPSSRPRDVVTVRDSHVLLAAVGASRLKPEVAVEQGLIVRQKIEGMWLYAADYELIELAREEMEQHCVSAAHDWFIGHVKQVAGRARKSVGCQLHPQAAQQLLKLHLRRGVLGALGQLSQYYDPYLVVYAADEQEEVDRIIKGAIDRLEKLGVLEVEDVPATTAPRELDDWRVTILLHLEFLGYGWLAYGRLIGTGS